MKCRMQSTVQVGKGQDGTTMFNTYQHFANNGTAVGVVYYNPQCDQEWALL